jgi:hypothetical protein
MRLSTKMIAMVCLAAVALAVCLGGCTHRPKTPAQIILKQHFYSDNQTNIEDVYHLLEGHRNYGIYTRKWDDYTEWGFYIMDLIGPV